GEGERDRALRQQDGGHPAARPGGRGQGRPGQARRSGDLRGGRRGVYGRREPDALAVVHQARENSAASMAPSSWDVSSRPAAATLSRACSALRALGITMTVGDWASAHASATAWADTTRAASIGASTGWPGNLRLRRPPPVGL